MFYAEIECTRRRSARSSEEIRRRPEIYLRLNLKLDAKELLSLRSLVDSVMKSIESFTVFGSLYETLSLGNALNNARYVFAQHEAGHFLVGYSIGILPKGYMVPSIEALRQRKFIAARVEFMVSSSLKKESVYSYLVFNNCSCLQVAIPRMLKKDTCQLDDRDWIDRTESSMQEEGYGSVCEDDHFMCIARNS
ncbi:hypothetical protein EZV62_006966 [Acer yangbiense]|uniref:Uncharacterized protein n=1 Tax=Acer yangbiense TaxID=1000413 RepID=A0A5C7I982_9ROSI|nr:hypothetical protein EZV62_006966 [Acer yangbiense]